MVNKPGVAALVNNLDHRLGTTVKSPEDRRTNCNPEPPVSLLLGPEMRLIRTGSRAAVTVTDLDTGLPEPPETFVSVTDTLPLVEPKVTLMELLVPPVKLAPAGTVQP